jgi:Fe2+ transport system protein B
VVTAARNRLSLQVSHSETLPAGESVGAEQEARSRPRKPRAAKAMRPAPPRRLFFCGAKLPVYALLVGAFFSQHEALMMSLITDLAWSGALLAAKFLRVTLIKGAGMPFVMELPPYRAPTFKGLFLHTWERTFQYIKKAGTIILSISILLWAMMTFPQLPTAEKETFAQKKAALLSAAPADVALELENSEEPTGLSSEASELKDQVAAIDAEQAEEALRHSIAGRIGVALEPISAFAGFDWRTNIAVVAGFAAKEVVVSTVGTASSLILGIVTVAVAYIVHSFYRKLRNGQPEGGGCRCSGGGCSGSCDRASPEGRKPPEA